MPPLPIGTRAAGFHLHLTKPITLDDLQRAITSDG